MVAGWKGRAGAGAGTAVEHNGGRRQRPIGRRLYAALPVVGIEQAVAEEIACTR
jgi:hypothetical protein